jgi:tetraprenyl-beta-curcumene synthase
LIDELRQSWRWGQEYFRHVRPSVTNGLAPLKQRADAIPHPALRQQALSSLNTKQFHCEGGGVFAGPSRDAEGLLLKFLLPYQTLCDYLDTVTDRGPSTDPANLRQLHQALIDAVRPGSELQSYYALHPDKDDGGYAEALVNSSRAALLAFPGIAAVQPALEKLVHLYVDLQVYKHGPPAERVQQLTGWHQQHADWAPGLSWWEFSAAAGSTLGLFALLNMALDPAPDAQAVDRVLRLYFPWVGALHILLDYYVDQEEDLAGGDLNFVTYYASPQDAVQGMQRIFQETLKRSRQLLDGGFHRYIAKGLLGFYLADPKMRRGHGSKWGLLLSGGLVSLGIYLAALVGRSP